VRNWQLPNRAAVMGLAMHNCDSVFLDSCNSDNGIQFAYQGGHSDGSAKTTSTTHRCASAAGNS
jgi:hypothetical protein